MTNSQVSKGKSPYSYIHTYIQKCSFNVNWTQWPATTSYVGSCHLIRYSPWNVSYQQPVEWQTHTPVQGGSGSTAASCLYPKCPYSESILSFKNFPFLPEKLMGLGMRPHSSYRGRSEVTLINSIVRAVTAAGQWSMLKATHQVQSAVIVTQKYQ